MTITLGWWIFPLGLFIAGVFIFISGVNENGMFAGVIKIPFAFALFIGAIVALITGLVV